MNGATAHQQLHLTSAELKDVLCVSICSRLGVDDLQALSKTCRSLRQLVLYCLPSSTWESVVAATLPDGHVLRKLRGCEVKDYIDRVARAKQVLPPATKLGEPQHTAKHALLKALSSCAVLQQPMIAYHSCPRSRRDAVFHSCCRPSKSPPVNSSSVRAATERGLASCIRSLARGRDDV